MSADGIYNSGKLSSLNNDEAMFLEFEKTRCSGFKGALKKFEDL